MKRRECRMEQGAGGLDLYRRRGRLFITVRETPEGRRYGKKLAMRRAYMKLVEDWYMMGEMVHRSWSSQGDDGLRSFITANMRRQSQGRPLELLPGHGRAGLASVSAASGPLPGTIMLALGTGESEGAYCTVFAQRLYDGYAAGLMQSFDCGPVRGYASMITGLAPGEHYYCYAVIADREFTDSGVALRYGTCRGVAGTGVRPAAVD